MKRHISVGVVALLVFALSTVAAMTKANFSGTWVMDKTRTEGLPPDISQTMTVTQEGDMINLETKVISDEGDQTVPASYALGGKEVEYKQARNGIEGKGKRTANWSDGGNGFEVSEEEVYDTPQGATVYKFMRKWTMATDGKTLTIVMDVKGPGGNQTIKRTFVKQ